MHVPIPYWYAGIDLAVYTVAALVSFLITYYAIKIYNVSKHRRHFFFYMAFAVLGLAFFTLAASLNFAHFCGTFCSSKILSLVTPVRNMGYLLYFSLATISYLLFTAAYSKKGAASLSPAVFLLSGAFYNLMWYFLFHIFNFILFVLLVFVISRNFSNYRKTRDRNSYLVLFGFVMIGVYHVLMAVSYAADVLYPVGHIFLFAGFLSFFVMLRRVGKA